jgi:orotidine-5'-phosphate decarboxylase
MLSKLIVALDVDDLKSAENLVDQLKDYVSIFKVGSQLFTSHGPEAIKAIQAKGCQVFLDLKYHDIPSTVFKAVRDAAKHRVWGITIHASSGFWALKEAMKAANLQSPVASHQRRVSEELADARPKILGITVLTSMKESDLRKIGMNRKVEKQVKRLAKLARNARLDGVVASAKEIGIIRRTCRKDFLIVTPGVRPQGVQVDDQRRVLTPREAIARGADYIVVGRPIVKADDPVKVVRDILESIGI